MATQNYLHIVKHQLTFKGTRYLFSKNVLGSLIYIEVTLMKISYQDVTLLIEKTLIILRAHLTLTFRMVSVIKMTLLVWTF